MKTELVRGTDIMIVRELLGGLYFGNPRSISGEPGKRDEFLRHVADRAGYGEAGATRDACVKLGTELLRSGKREEGRKYLWMAAQYAQTMDPDSQRRIVQRLTP